MLQLISIIIVLPLLGFWLWMFRDLINNVYLPGNSRYYWTLAFIFLNVFGAGLYYFYEYRDGHL